MNDSKVCEFIPSDSQVTKTTYVKGSAILIVGAISILGNAFIIILSLKYTIRRNLTHLIVNMAVADILVTVMGCFFDAATLLGLKNFFANTNIAILDNLMCKTFQFLKHTSPLVTLSSLLIISIERFKATSPTMQAPRPYTKTRRLVILGCSWFFPMLLSGFGLFAIVEERDRPNECRILDQNEWRCFETSAAVLTFLGILTLTIISLKRLHRPQVIIAHMSEEQARARLKKTSRAIKMVLFSIILYSTYCPLFFDKFVYLVVYSRDKQQRYSSVCLDWETLDYLKHFLPLVNSCLSPVVYLAFLRDYQEGAKKMFCGNCSRRKSQIKDQKIQVTRTHNSRKDTSNGVINLGNNIEETRL